MALPKLTAKFMKNIDDFINIEIDSLVSLYKLFHTNPELSGQEKETSAILAEELKKCGFTVTTGVGGFGVVAEMENGKGPCVMLRADMDALPVTEESGVDYSSTVTTLDDSGNMVGVMHACGHDVHMTSLVGAARVLSANRESWKGRLVLIGQPAEESMCGAKAMLEDGLYDKFGTPDYCLATHVMPGFEAGKIVLRSGPVMAGTFQFFITVHGVGGHGAIPQEAKDPIVLSARIVNSLQTIISRDFAPTEPGVLTIGSIHGGTRPNIIPGKVMLEGTARFFSKESRERLIEGIERVCRHEALSMGIPEDILPEVKFDYETELPPTINSPELVDSIHSVVERLMGSENICEAPMVMGSEDFSLFRTGSEMEVLCCLFFTGATSVDEMKLCRNKGTPPPSLHNSKFVPEPEKTISSASTIMAATVVEVMGDSKQ